MTYLPPRRFFDLLDAAYRAGLLRETEFVRPRPLAFMHKSEMVLLEPESIPEKKKPRHHDQFIQRHVRSHQYRNRRA